MREDFESLRTGVLLSAGLFLAACGAPAGGGPVPETAEILAAVLRNSDLRLADGQWCENIGQDPSAATVAEYVSGLLGEFSDQGVNSVEAACEDDSERYWRCRVMFHREFGEEVWGWGLDFRIGKSDRKLDRSSLSCVGAG